MECQPDPMLQNAKVKPLLSREAVERTGDDRLPGHYCEQRHVWMVKGRPIVEAHSLIAELTTKTDAVIERDDSSDISLMEMQTKTKAEIEHDDQSFEIQ